MRRSLAAGLLLSLAALPGCRHLRRVVGDAGDRPLIEYAVQLDAPTALAVTQAQVNAAVEEAIRSTGADAVERDLDVSDSSPYLLLVGTVLNAEQHRIRMRWTAGDGLCTRTRDAILENRGELAARVREVLECVQADDRRPGRSPVNTDANPSRTLRQ